MNKKAASQILGITITLILLLLVLIIGVRIYQNSDSRVDGIGNLAEELMGKLGSNVNLDDPCPCSEGSQRVDIRGTLFCRFTMEGLTQNQCETELRFSYTQIDGEGVCYYTREQCLMFLRENR